MSYGTGAIMAVPAHDERDHAFATRVRPADRARSSPAARSPVQEAAYTGDGRAGRTRGFLDGLDVDAGARRA